MASRTAAVAAPARSPSRRSPSRPAEPATRPRPRRAPATRPAPTSAVRGRTRRLLASGAIAWIVVGAVLLAGVVFVNLLDLRLNLRLEQATQARAQLSAKDALLESELSSALASVRIQQLSSRQGLVQADTSSIGYINLGR